MALCIILRKNQARKKGLDIGLDNWRPPVHWAYRSQAKPSNKLKSKLKSYKRNRHLKSSI